MIDYYKIIKSMYLRSHRRFNDEMKKIEEKVKFNTERWRKQRVFKMETIFRHRKTYSFFFILKNIVSTNARNHREYENFFFPQPFIFLYFKYINLGIKRTMGVDKIVLGIRTEEVGKKKEIAD